MSDQREQEGFMFRTDLFRDTVSFDDQVIGGDQNMGGHNGNVNAEWKLNDRNFLTSSLSMNAFGFENNSINEYTRFQCGEPSETACARADRSVVDEWDVLSDAEFSNTNVGTTLGYRHTIEPQRDELIAEVRYNFTRDETPNQLRDLPGDISAREDRLFDVDQTADQREMTAQLDWITPVGSSLKLEAGYKGTLRGIDNEYLSRIFRGDDLTLQPDSTTADDFVYDETINALYAVGTRDFGRFDLQGGLRAEHTATEFEGASGLSENDYFSMIPSAALLYELSEGGMQSLRASYSRRIRRPQARQVNPLPIVQDARRRPPT